MRQVLNINDRQINLALKEFQLDEDEWDYSDLMKEIHNWFVLFNDEFNLKLPTPSFGIRKLHKKKLGTYLASRNQHGFEYEILFNSKHLDPFCEILATLIHEMIHLRQHLYGEPPTTKRSGHNDEFRHWMKQLGILTNRYGYDTVQEGPFTELLRMHDIEYEAPAREEPKPRKKNTKWTCSAGCYEIPVPEGETLQLECKRCDTMLECVK